MKHYTLHQFQECFIQHEIIGVEPSVSMRDIQAWNLDFRCVMIKDMVFNME